MRRGGSSVGVVVLVLGCNGIFDIQDPNSDGSSEYPGAIAGATFGPLPALAGEGGEAGNPSTVLPLSQAGSGGAPSALDSGVNTVSLTGRLVRYESGLALGMTEMSAYFGSEEVGPSSSLADGSFNLPGIARGVTVTLEMTAPGSEPVLAFRQTALATQSGDADVRQLTPVAVSFPWLEQTASECGALASATEEERQRYFNQHATAIVQVFDASGVPVPGISRNAVEVTLASSGGAARANRHGVGPGAPFVCVLELANGSIVGGRATETTELGSFAVFGVRNADGTAGTGEGTARATVDGGFPPSLAVLLRQSGKSAVLRIGRDW